MSAPKKKKTTKINTIKEENPTIEYCNEIDNGNIIACKKINAVVHYLRKLVNGEREDIYYNSDRANHAIFFIENFCRNIAGSKGGQLIKLMLWQKCIIAAIFGLIDKDTECRHFREVFLLLGKKNGKSVLAAAIGLYMLLADNEAGPEVYSVATRREQAKIIWNTAKNMINESPPLQKRTRCLVGSIECDYNHGRFVPLSSDKNKMDGDNTHCVLIDELHQWRNGAALYDRVTRGVSARTQPLIVVCTTAGDVRDDIYDQKYEQCCDNINAYTTGKTEKMSDRLLPFLFEIDDLSDLKDEKNWIKANPGLGVIKSLEFLRDGVKNALTHNELLPDLLTKDFNRPQSQARAFLTWESVENCGKQRYNLEEMQENEDTAFTYAIGGVDLSKYGDLTCACILMRRRNDPKIYVHSHYWIPADTLEKHKNEDKKPYDLWIKQGYISLCTTPAVDTKEITKWFKSIGKKYDIHYYRIGYDSWSATEWVESMKQQYGEKTMVPIKQYAKILSNPMELLKKEFESGNIIYNNNPVDKWCFANVRAITDSNGNVKPDKAGSRFDRIDGFAALLDAYCVYTEQQSGYLNLVGFYD